MTRKQKGGQRKGSCSRALMCRTTRATLTGDHRSWSCLSRRAQRAFVWTALPFCPMVSSTQTANCGGFRRTSVPASVTKAFMADSMTALQKPDGGVRGSAALSRDRLPKRWFVDSAQGGCSLRAIPVRILCQSRPRLRGKCHQGTDGRTLTLQPQYCAERHCRRCATSQV